MTNSLLPTSSRYRTPSITRGAMAVMAGAGTLFVRRIERDSGTHAGRRFGGPAPADARMHRPKDFVRSADTIFGAGMNDVRNAVTGTEDDSTRKHLHTHSSIMLKNNENSGGTFAAPISEARYERASSARQI